MHAHSPDELLAAGKRLRTIVPRNSQGIWKKPSDRADAITQLQGSDPDRLSELLPVRYGRMLVSPFTFYRGAAGVMAADLSTAPATGLHVQVCGDCHLLNFGGFATPERNIIFDINDFDETLPAPWEWDIKRLAASFVLAARSIGLSDANGRDAAVAATLSYRKRLAEYAKMSPLAVWYASVDAEDLLGLLTDPAIQKRARRRIAKATERSSGSELDYPELAGMVGGQIHIRDAPPLIFHPEEARAPDFMASLEVAVTAYRETLPEDRRALFDRYRLVDAAIKVVGIGSVGRRCWIALFMSAGNDPLFLQFKEATQSVLEPYARRSAYPHHGQRVVMGQRLMQPASDVFLGWVTGPSGRHFYVRQLRDAKIKPLVETFDAETLLVFGEACGWALARGHAKAGDAWTISGYLGGSDQFDIAMGRFALAYADQAEADHAALKRAVRAGRVQVLQEAST
ncbi:MAG TPA: DUF2252 domain-containing protein [Acetobacteraceae bacterium]|nr:DUF2252 domain-containing protein [Acetobacteraceae bacterium]